MQNAVSSGCNARGSIVDSLFSELQENTDFEYFAACHITAETTRGITAAQQSMKTNFPKEWTAHYRSTGLIGSDPVIQFAPRTSRAICWQTVRNCASFQKKHDQVYKAAGDFGIHSGVLLSSRQFDGSIQIVSFSSSRKKAYSDKDLSRATYYGQLIGQAVSDTVPSEGEAQSAGGISPRALECLQLAALGKSSAEIEIILNISRHTVDFHIRNAMAALGVNTRTFAVVRAVQQGLILPC
ncbi:LuxR family transcriptional regulator [Leisingera sp. HS039]|uniref:helix-turn-helix transcriptional regulator n=1 Tax=unclassified Leisingera TaxID=2614906 RepID=UPI0010712C05|nr:MULTISPECIES: LuxR family transcriptional regulator [unclassified Leisingera]MBQ4825836.1 LuxR family transcriptional regulator [Leisingera sp. HS039]QBR38822.1 LuxR family transcriptional regulator [Leisingera sp. NJS201]